MRRIRRVASVHRADAAPRATLFHIDRPCKTCPSGASAAADARPALGTDFARLGQAAWRAVRHRDSAGLSDVLAAQHRLDVCRALRFINAADADGMTLLMHAAAAGDIAGVRTLISNQADPACCDRAGLSAVVWAQLAERDDVVEYFASHGLARPLALPPTQTECITSGMVCGHASLLAVARCRGWTMDSPTYRVIMRGNVAGGQSHAVSHWLRGGLAPLSALCHLQPLPHVVEAALKAGGDVDQRTAEGWAPLMLACANRHVSPATLTALCAAGADAAAANRGGWAPVHLCAAHHTAPAACLAVLLAYGAAPNAPCGDTAWTALHLLMERCDDPRAVSTLLEGGANPDLRGRHAPSARDLARARKRVDSLAVVESWWS